MCLSYHWLNVEGVTLNAQSDWQNDLLIVLEILRIGTSVIKNRMLKTLYEKPLFKQVIRKVVSEFENEIKNDIYICIINLKYFLHLGKVESWKIHQKHLLNDSCLHHLDNLEGQTSALL